VLLIADGDNITLGKPTIEGARVLATSKGDGKNDKVIIFKFKSKIRYRVKNGHRQQYTRLSIDKISQPGAVETEAPAPKPRRKKKEVAEDGA
jgi:large subunit ribosomal protein L21